MTKLSDEYIQEIYVDGIKPVHNATIHLEEYNEEWPLLFQREKQRIESILKDNALMVEHIGSTSVPGLCAKPIIDILLVVEDTSDEDSYRTALCENGYNLRLKEPEFENHHLFKGPDTDINLHVFPIGSKEINRYLAFRNYLRNHVEARQLYASTKKELSKKVWKYVQNYADAKDEVVNQIMEKALFEYSYSNK